MVDYTARWCLSPAGDHTPDATTNVTLSWSAYEPLAVRMDITQPDGTGVAQWLLARDLLAQGLAVPAGQGDVRVGPHPHSAGLLVVTLGWEPGHQVQLATGAEEVADFLARTYTVVGRGAEHEGADIDAELADLLGGGGPR